MKVVLVNVKYSPNLGDGVIAECLENGLRKRLNGVEIANCDLAGRRDYGAGPNLVRSIAVGALPALPHRLKQTVFARLLEAIVRRRLMPLYRQKMEGADVAIFAGGQILADADLNFPMKIAAAAAIARENGLAIGVHGVGVGRLWSYKGALLFREAFAGCNLFWATVRDKLSVKRWERHFAGSEIAAPKLSFDTGLLTEKAYGPINGPVNGERRNGKNQPRIGVCVTRPATLKLHYDGTRDVETLISEDFYVAVVKALANRGFEVELFTSGAPDDDRFMRRCFTKSVLNEFDPDQITIADRSLKPADLVDSIRNCDGVIAHRLHANIIAYSYKIPHIGLGLNRKLDEFFDLSERSDFLLGPDLFDPETIADKMQEALDSKISDERHGELMKLVDKDLDQLADAVRRAVMRRRPNGAL